MVRIPGGECTIGSDRHYPEERPAHRARVDEFLMDACAVTNRQFAAFVAETGYLTLAEQKPDPADYPGADPAMLVPGAVVFTRTRGPVDLRDPSRWWRWVPGASWHAPGGPGTDLTGLGEHPVTQVAYEDAAAYAAWAGKALPSEAQWEFAARGGLAGAEFAWGDELTPGGRIMANTWHGRFPWENLAPAGYAGTAPVDAFEPNGYGLYQMCGNVWEWTADWYRDGHVETPCCGGRAASVDERLGSALPRKVVKGGSWLCAPSYCRRYRPAARQGQTVDTATVHMGFRCIRT
jgi:formylglycine-generating enzyme required for sulfatase activity